MKFFKQSVIFFILLFFVCGLNAQTGNVLLPIAFYTNETGLGLGATDIFYFKNDGEKHHSAVNTMFFGTTKSQFMFAARPEIYISSLYSIDGFILFSDFNRQFYGLGNQSYSGSEEDYKNFAYGIGFGIHRKLTDSIKAGIIYDIQNLSVKNKKSGGLIEQYDTEGLISGAGLKISYDTRDNNLYARDGWLLELSWLVFDSKTGSSFDYSETEIDLRNYFQLSKKILFSFQSYFRLLNGYPPVQILSTFGGANRMRGYYSGRYVDNIVMIVQPELKIELSDLFQIALFSGVGNVYHDLESIDITKIKTASGAGLRIKLKDNPRINIRTDFGFSSESSGFYITILEAF